MANWLISAKPPITKGNLNENHVFILDILNDYRSLSLQVLNEWLGENQSFGAGSAESPSLKFTSGGGLFAPDTHSIAIASSGLTRLRIASTGSAVVGATAPTAGVGLDVSLAPTGAVNTVGVKVTGEVQPDVSTEHQAFSSYPKVKTGTTLAALTHYCASQPTLGGDVTTQAGFKVSDSLTGAENNYGFYGLLSAAAGRYNLYMSGTAKNFLQGNTGIGVLPDDTYTLKVYGQSYLPWVQSGADGVARDVATRLRDRCCVEDFGATGVDDDTDAFQSAIDWLPASGGTIWLTKEDYRIDGTLNAGTKLIKWANVRKINSLVHHGKLPGVTETFCSGAAGYYEIQRAVAKETDGYTLSVYRDANYTGTSATDTASVKSRLYLRSTIGTSGQTKVESGVSTDVVNESLYAAGYALAAYAKRMVDGRTVGIYCVADDYAAGAGLTKTTLSGDFELRCADTDANSMRTIMRLTAHSQNAVDYDEDAKISTGLRVRASTANLGVAIGVDQIGNAEIDTGLDLSDVEFESDAIAIRTDNWINLAGDEETRKGLRYNSSTQLIEVSKPFAVGTTSLCTNLNADLLDGQEGSYYTDIPSRLGYTPVNKAGDTMTGGLKVTGTVAAKDRVAVGGESFWTGRGVVVQGSTVCTGNTSTMGYYSNVAIGNDVTTSHYQYYSYPSVAAGENTLSTLMHFGAQANTFGQTVTNQYGFYAGSTLTGAVNNYGFYGNIPSGTSRYNCYMGGTAYNYFSGNTGIGVQPDDNNKLAISGAIAITGTPTITGTTDYAHLYTADITAGNRAVHTRTENGSVIKFYQQALIASPSADVSSLKTAVDAIRTLLINNGLMASS
jgi:hypothetical protein